MTHWELMVNHCSLDAGVIRNQGLLAGATWNSSTVSPQTNNNNNNKKPAVTHGFAFPRANQGTAKKRRLRETLREFAEATSAWRC